MSGKGRPVGQRVGQRTHLGSVGLEFEASAQPAHHGLENFAIRMEFSLLGFGFQFRVEAQEFGVGDGLAVGGENGAQRGEDSRLPVDERAVAVEGHQAELSEVQHGAFILFASKAAKANPGPAPWAAV